jgi:hypothetical protein
MRAEGGLAPPPPENFPAPPLVKGQHMHEQPSPYSTISSSSIMSTMPLTTEGVDLASYDNLLSCKSNVGEIQLIPPSTKIDYNEFNEIGIII